MKLSRKSENAVANDRVLKFLFDDATQHIEAVVQASMRNMSYCEGTLQALHVAICFVCTCMYSKLRLDEHFHTCLQRCYVTHRLTVSAGKSDLVRIGFRVRFWVV